MKVIWDPVAIEKKSMEIIESYLFDFAGNDIEKAVVKRVIHTSGDPEIVRILRFHPRAALCGVQALKQGRNVYTDVNMLKTGINASRINANGGQVFCSIADQEIAVDAKKLGITRAAASMRHFGRALDGAVVAIGNAPTALFELINLIENGVCQPALVVATPVGFVGAAESKELLLNTSPVPFITLQGTRGGSPIAASIINALLYFEEEVPNG